MPKHKKLRILTLPVRIVSVLVYLVVLQVVLLIFYPVVFLIILLIQVIIIILVLGVIKLNSQKWFSLLALLLQNLPALQLIFKKDEVKNDEKDTSSQEKR